MKSLGPTAQSPTFRLKPLVTALCLLGATHAPLIFASPSDGVVQSGTASISQSGNDTRIQQSSDRAVINWRSFSTSATESVTFVQPSAHSATLNRVTGEQVSMLLGRLDANGQVILINPNGIVFGAGSQINVGSLIASTSNLGNDNFMAGKLVFDEAGKSGAGIVNQGRITAAEGGLVALVAPHVRNDGLIQARLGKVLLGAGDTFSIDLYGDDLIHFALQTEPAGNQQDGLGQPVTSLINQAGRIEADGGKVMLVSAPAAKAVLDQVINLSGTIQANSVAQHNGQIVLLGQGGSVEVSGSLSAHGNDASGGRIDVLGDQVALTHSARLDASGSNSGGSVHVGGGYQGGEGLHRAQTTQVANGAQINADANQTGNGGEVVVWSDGDTTYAGKISARGGDQSGNGGRVEVSGKGTLEFLGNVDAGASHGQGGSLLLDPTDINLGATEAGQVMQVLRTGTSVSLLASQDIAVNTAIDGRGGASGGGLSLTAGRNLTLNQSIVTNAGAINLTASNGTVTTATSKGLYSLGGNITVAGNTGLTLGDVSSGAGHINASSSTGNITLNGNLVSTGLGSATVSATQGSISTAAGKGIYTAGGAINLTAGTTLGADILASSGGNIGLTSGSGIALAGDIASSNGSVTANSGGALSLATGKGIYAGSGNIDLTATSQLLDGYLLTTGITTLTSTSGAINLNSAIAATHGSLNLLSAGAVSLGAAILNGTSGANLVVTAAGPITVSGQIDARGGTSGGTVNLSTSSGDITLNQDIATNAGSITLSASNGTVTTAASKGLYSLGGNVSVAGRNGLTLGNVSSGTGTISASSSNGNIALNGDLIASGSGTVGVTASSGSISTGTGKGIYTATGGITLAAGTTLTATSLGTGILASGGGNIGLTSGTGGMTLAGKISTGGGHLTANSGGSINASSGGGIYAGAGNISLTGSTGVSTAEVDTRGSFTLGATAGAATLTGAVSADDGINVTSSGDVTVNGMLSTVNSPIAVTSTAGAIKTTSLTPDTTGFFVGDGVPVSGTQGLGTGNISLNALNAIDTWELATQGAISATSTNGTIHINKTPDERNTGITLNAGGTVDLGTGAGGRGLLSTGPINITVGATGLSLDSGTNNLNQITSSAGDVSVTSTGSILGGFYQGNSVTLHSTAGNIDSALVHAVSSANLDALASISNTVVAVTGGTSTRATLHSTTGDIGLSAYLGGTLNVTADAGSITAPWSTIPHFSGVANLNAGTDISLGNIQCNNLALTAGRDILFPDAGTPTHSWLDFQTAQLNAGRDISIGSTVTVSDSLGLSAPNGAVNISGRVSVGTYSPATLLIFAYDFGLTGTAEVTGQMTVIANHLIWINQGNLATNGHALLAPIVIRDDYFGPPPPPLTNGFSVPQDDSPTPISATSVAPIALAEIPVSLPAPSSPSSAPVDVAAPSLPAPSSNISLGSSSQSDTAVAINAAEQTLSPTEGGDVPATGGGTAGSGGTPASNGPVLVFAGGRGPAKQVDMGLGSNGVQVELLAVLGSGEDCQTPDTCRGNSN